MSNENKRRPKEGWRQLNFKTIICLPTPKCAAIFFALLFIFSLVLTCVILSLTYQILEKKSDTIKFNGDFDYSEGKVTITLTKSDIDKIKGPLFIYIETEDYYQNHRIYLKSKSKEQLSDTSTDTLSTDCSPLVKDGELDINFGIYDKNHYIVPCGLMPASFINTTISISVNGETVNIDSDGISWKYDNSDMYKTHEFGYLDIEDKHFKVWMRNSPTSTLRKLYGKIDEKDAKEGIIEFNVELYKNYLEYLSDKRIIITTTTRIGGKNKVLGWAYFVICVVSFSWSVFFAVMSKYHQVPDIKDVFKKFSS
ncbi:hypothetical protein SteCoe_15859 [Stentor coeruleus]|uniref:Uncharacterized protein n=1 Tax=Stentor coeruleus TaxID=5963 RepID=A0A1R2C2R1_9CILI|nr:hypothetical protein SteCoe_15859 [Stentor coeruleus]